MEKLKTIDLFAGIGGLRLAFEKNNCQNVFTSEWDKDAQKMYEDKKYDNFCNFPS